MESKTLYAVIMEVRGQPLEQPDKYFLYEEDAEAELHKLLMENTDRRIHYWIDTWELK